MNEFEQSLFSAINGLSGSSVLLDALAVFMACWLIFVMVAVVIVICLKAIIKKHEAARKIEVARDLALSIRVALAVAGAILDGLLISLLFFRNRPFVLLDNVNLLIGPPMTIKSFPSDHTTIAFAIAVSVLLVHRRLGIFLLCCATGVAVGRVMVGVHFPFDVLVGAALGSVWALVIALIASQFKDVRWVRGQLAKIYQKKI